MGAQGQRLGIRHLPVGRAGLYVPGGLGAYASTVIMNAVPALVAGVGELSSARRPGGTGAVNRSVLAAARLMGIERVFRVGGAQAIAAMAYGTETIPRVDVICGPGNAYVMEAKRQVYGSVGIDNLAGPSEVLVVADRTARPDWIAADLLAQEEHGSGAPGRAGGGDRGAVPRRWTRPSRCSWRARGAPAERGRRGALRRHRDPRASAAFYPAPGEDFLRAGGRSGQRLRARAPGAPAGRRRARFLPGCGRRARSSSGHCTPTAFGDYMAGSNHVLPTGGSARFSSPLSVDTFMRRSSYVEMTAEAVAAADPAPGRAGRQRGLRLPPRVGRAAATPRRLIATRPR